MRDKGSEFIKNICVKIANAINYKKLFIAQIVLWILFSIAAIITSRFLSLKTLIATVICVGAALLVTYIINIKTICDADESKTANDLKSSFLANMSHEIRTPINAILSMDEMILRENDNPSIKEYATDIQRAGKSLLVIINDILDFSKIEAGKLEILPMDYKTKDLVKDIDVTFKEKAADKGLEFTTNISSNIPTILYGDFPRIKQVIINLANNAVKYTDKGQVNVGFDFIDGNIVVKVQDTGKGIKQEDISKLFAKFERIDEQSNRKTEGTGLGMSITVQLVDLMDGILDVESEYGEGSTFTIKIPQQVKSEKILKKSDLLEVDEEDTTGKYFYAPDANILITDDNDLNLKSIQLLLKRSEVKIDTASSGDECLLKCRKKRYDIIFIDHMMPGKDGVETFKELKDELEYKLNRKTPVIMLTANALSGVAEKFISLGFSGYLSKPVDTKKLEGLMKKYIPWGEFKTEESIENNSVSENAKQDIKADTDIKVRTLSEDSGNSPSINESLKNNDASGTDKKDPVIPLFDKNIGLGNLETEDNLAEIIYSFVNNHETVFNELDALFVSKNIGQNSDYQIKVHALKSSTRTIGMMKLSKLCENLEMACKSNKLSYIEKNHRHIRPIYEKTVKLSEFDEIYKIKQATQAENNEDIKEYPPIEKILSAIIISIDDGDINTVDELFEKFEAFLKTTDYYEDIKNSIWTFNSEKLKEIVLKLEQS